MRCKNIKDILLSDYLDGSIDRDGKKAVDEHLSRCEDCRMFFEEVKSSAVEPFSGEKVLYPSEKVWEIIRKKTYRPGGKSFSSVVTGLIRDLFYMNKPVVVLVSFVLFAFIGIKSIDVYNHSVAADYLEDQIVYLNPVKSEDDTAGKGFGTGIEEFFL